MNNFTPVNKPDPDNHSIMERLDIVEHALQLLVITVDVLSDLVRDITLTVGLINKDSNNNKACENVDKHPKTESQSTTQSEN